MKDFFLLVLMYYPSIFINSQCVSSDSGTKLCEFCSYDYYNSKNDIVLSSMSQTSIYEGDCIHKTLSQITRNILISNSYIPANNDFAVYDDILIAFLSENLFVKQYNSSNLIFYLTAGIHYIVRQDLNQTFYLFFQRINSTIKIKPLYCSEYNITDLCVEDNSNIKIIVKTLFFSIYISNYMEISNIIFDSIDSIYPFFNDSSSCLLSKSVSCCNESLLNNSNYSNCYIFHRKLSQFNSDYAKNSLFILFNIIDIPSPPSPKLVINNCKFSNFYFIEQSNQFIKNIFLLSADGTALEFINSEIADIYTFNSIFTIYDQILLYPSTIQPYLKLENASFYNFNLYQISKTNISSNYEGNYLDFMGFSGMINLTNISFIKIWNLDQKKYIINLQNLKNSFLLQNLEFLNIYNMNILNVDSSFGNLTNLKINLSFWNDSTFNIINSSLIIFNKYSLLNSSSALDNIYMIYIQYSNVILLTTKFSFVKNISFYFYNSNIEIQNSSFENSLISKNGKILSFSTHLKLTNIKWFLISSTTFFSYTSLDIIHFYNNTFLNCTSPTFISGTTVNSLIMNNSRFENIFGITAFIGGGATIYNFNFINTVFLNLDIAQNFAILNIANLYISNCVFKTFTYTKSKANNLIQFQYGAYLIDSSRFENIKFSVAGNQIISLKTGNVNISNSQFYNNGWLYVVDIKTKSAIEFVDVIYIWTCYDVFIINNTFLNVGGISLFSGFIISTLHQGTFVIDNCSFIARNKTSIGLSYHGVLLFDSPIVKILNNYFEGLECCNFSSIEHNNGVLALQGENSYLRKGNKKIAIVLNNTFYDCKCQNGGSIGIINFLNVSISNIFINKTKSTIRGGAIEIISCPFVTASNLTIINSQSTKGSILFLLNSQEFIMNQLYVKDSLTSKGGIYTTSIHNLIFSEIFINNIFAQNTAGVFLFFGGYNILKNIIIYNSTAFYEGGVFGLDDNAILIIYDLSSELTSAFMGGFLCSFSSIEININKATLISSSSIISGGSLYIDSLITLNISDIYFVNNTCENHGVIYFKSMEIYSLFILNNLTFHNSSASIGNFIYSESYGFYIIQNIIVENSFNCMLYFGWDSPISVMIENLTISSDISFNYLCWFIGINVTINNIIFLKNDVSTSLIRIESSLASIISNMKSLAPIKNLGLFELENAIIELNQIILDDKNHYITNNFLTMANYCQITLLNSSFISLQNDNGFIILAFSSLQISNCVFFEIDGPLISALDINSLEIYNSSFVYNKPSQFSAVQDIQIDFKQDSNNSQSILNNCLFLSSGGISMTISKIMNIYLWNSIFNGSNNASGLVLSDLKNLQLISCNFSNYIGKKGASLLLSNEILSSKTYIENCWFFKNEAVFGSSIYFYNISQIHINKTFFYDNIAHKIAAGILFFNYKIPEISIINCMFYNNFATFNHPNIFSSSPFISMGNFYQNNTDSLNVNYQQSCFPLKLILKYVNDNISLNYERIQVVSGNTIKLNFILADYFNQTFYSEKTLKARILSENQSDITLQNTDSMKTVIGELIFPQLLIKALPNSSFILKLSCSAPDYENITSFVFEQNFLFFSRPCIIGEIYTSSKTCSKCAHNFYSIVDPMIKRDYFIQCGICDLNAYCPGGSVLLPDPGYWRKSNISTKINKCLLSEACLGFDLNLISSNQEYWTTGNCAEGHYGNLCHECIRGYGKYQNNSLCSVCQSFAVWNIVRLLAVSIFVIIYLIYNAKTMSSDINSQLNDVLMKIIINHMQKITIISFIDLSSVVKDLNQVFSFLNVLSFLSEDIFSNDCFLQSFITDIDSIYLYKTMIVNILPLIFSIVCFLLYIGFSVLSKSVATNRISVIFFISVFLFYPLITKCSLSLLNCIGLDEFGNEYLYVSPNIQCWIGIHMFFFIIIGILGILLWGIGFPIMLIFFIRKRIFSEKYSKIGESIQVVPRGTLQEMQLTISNISVPNVKVENRKFSFVNKKGNPVIDKNMAYKFFYKDYKIKFYYWESLIFTQKFGISLFQNIPKIIGQENADILFLLVLLIYYAALIQNQPFKIQQMNILENYSVICAILCKVLFVISQSYDESYRILVFLYSLIFILNLLFFGLVFFYFVKLTQWRKILENSSHFFKHYSNKISPKLFSFMHSKSKILHIKDPKKF